MITRIRNSMKSIFVKIISILLLLSFVLWGMSGVISSKKSDTIVRVGKIDFSFDSVMNLYRKQMKEEGREDTSLMKEDMPFFLQHVITSTLFTEEADRLGVFVPNEEIKRTLIASAPALVKEGVFDQGRFNQMIKDRGMTEASFFKEFASQIAVRNLFACMEKTVPLYGEFAADIENAIKSKREVALYKVNYSKIKVDAQPTKEDLQKTLDLNKSLFTIPEKRTVSFLVVSLLQESLEKFRSSINRSDIEKFYNDNLYAFTKPEQRKILKIVFKSEASAKSAYEQIANGANFADIAKAAGENIDFVQAPFVEKENFSDIDVASAIFSVEKDAVTQPILTPIGWLIVKVVEIIPEKISQLTPVVEEEIIKQLQEQKRFDAYTAMIKNIESDLNKNIAIEDIAITHKISLRTAQIEKPGLDFNYSADSLLQNEKFLTAVFSTNLNNTSPVIDLMNHNENVIVKVSAIEQEYVQPVEKIQSALLSIWQNTEKKARASEMVDRLLKNIKNDNDAYLESVRADVNSGIVEKQLKVVGLLDNNEDLNSGVDIDNVLEIFKTQSGQFTGILQNKEDVLFFAKVLDTGRNSAKIASNTPQNKEMTGFFVRGLQELFFKDYLTYLETLHPVRIFEETLKEKIEQ